MYEGYLPGAGVRAVGNRLAGVVKGEGAVPLVCVGGDCISSIKSEELCAGGSRRPLKKFSPLGGMPLMCVIFHHKNVSRGRHSRAIEVNSWLVDHCICNVKTRF